MACLRLAPVLLLLSFGLACGSTPDVAPDAGGGSDGGGADAPDQGGDGQDQGDAPLPVSCAAILMDDAAAESGVFTIDPDGEGGSDAFDTWCEMDFDEGGWTLLAVISDDDNDRSTIWGMPESWTSAEGFGEVDLDGFDSDFKLPGWATMPWTQIYLQEESGEAWKRSDGAVTGSSLQELFSSTERVSLGGDENAWPVDVGDLTLERDEVYFLEVQNPPATPLVNAGERNRCILTTAYDGYDLAGGPEDQVEGWGCTAGTEADQDCFNDSCGDNSREASIRVFIR